MKKLTVRQVTSIKNTAKSVLPLTIKKAKLIASIEEANAELENITKQIGLWEAAVMDMTGGYTSEDLIIRKIVCAVNEDGTTKVDKNGAPVKTTKYEPNPMTLVFNEAENIYEVVEMIEEAAETPNVDEEAKVEEKADNTFDPATMHDMPAGSEI